MKKIAFVTDSNSGITPEMAKEMGVNIIPMPFFINEELYFEGISLSQEEFFEKLGEDADITTSQPSPGDTMDMYELLLKEYDQIVHIPMSAALSSTYETAAMLADDFDGRVQVIDNRKISITLCESIKDAQKLAADGKDAVEIKEILEENKSLANIYLVVDTLKYLKKGGRITPAAAAIGSVLNIKPVLSIGCERIEPHGKARGAKQGKKMLIEAIQNDVKGRFAGKNIKVHIAHTVCLEDAQKLAADLKEGIPELKYEIEIHDLSLSVACHVGPGVVAAAVMESMS